MAELDNDAHERFCEEYLRDLNGTAAYLRTYPNSGEAAAQSSSSALLCNPLVADRIVELKAERSRRVQVDLDRVLRELMVIGFSDKNHYEMTELGHLVETADAPVGASRAVASVTYKIHSNGEFTTREVTYKLWNKNDALKQLRDHVGGQVADEDDEDGTIPLGVIRKAVRAAEAKRRSKTG